MARMIVTGAVIVALLAACSKTSSSSGAPDGSPPPPPEPPKPIAIALGNFRTCALMEDGRVKCLGYNGEGELGIGVIDFDAHFDPTVVHSVVGVTALDASEWDTCALGPAGVVECWGDAIDGQLGSNVPGGVTAVADPVRLGNVSGATAIAVGATHTCAIVDGAVKCVGRSYANGSLSTSTDPIAVLGTGGATAMSAGVRYTCAIAGGRVKCWGTNDFGELGRDTQGVGDPRADFVSGIGTVTAISAGSYHSCAVLSDTTVSCWGKNDAGQLGGGTTTPFEIVPMPVSGLSSVVGIAAGGSHTCALVQGGTVKCWGSNACWNLGTQTGAGSSTPVAIGSVAGVQAISAGGEHTCVLTGGGVKCWGCNNSGVLGRHAKTEVPVDIPF